MLYIRAPRNLCLEKNECTLTRLMKLEFEQRRYNISEIQAEARILMFKDTKAGTNFFKKGMCFSKMFHRLQNVMSPQLSLLLHINACMYVCKHVRKWVGTPSPEHSMPKD